MADLALRLGLPLLVVVRAGLGTINHTRLTLAEAGRRGCRVAGVVISHGSAGISEADALNLGCLRDELGALLLAEIPPLEQGEEASGHFDAPSLERVINGA